MLEDEYRPMSDNMYQKLLGALQHTDDSSDSQQSNTLNEEQDSGLHAQTVSWPVDASMQPLHVDVPDDSEVLQLLKNPSVLEGLKKLQRK